MAEQNEGWCAMNNICEGKNYIAFDNKNVSNIMLVW